MSLYYHKVATWFSFLYSLLYQGHTNKQLHSVHPPTPCLVGELSLLPNFQKGGLTGSQFLEGIASTIFRFNLRKRAWRIRGRVMLLKEGGGGDTPADCYASLSCFSKSHSDYTVNISNTLLPRKYVDLTYFMSLSNSRYLAKLLRVIAAWKFSST